MPEDHQNPQNPGERYIRSAIHQRFDVSDYLVRAFVPVHLHQAFHEIVALRGSLPKYMSDEQGKLFGSGAVEITKRFHLSPEEGRALLIIFQQLVSQWLSQDAHLN